MSASPDSEGQQPFVSHLLELRDRLLRMVLAVLVVFLALFPFANDIYTFVADPLMAVLPEGTSMIATQVASPFLTPFKLSLVAAVFVAMPYLLYQLWAFVAPGLYQHERKMAFPLVASSILLFYAGAAFAYFVVFPLVFGFLTSIAPEGVAVMTDISAYLDFVLTLFFAFGLSFEVPIATIILVWMGMTTPQQLASKRPYVIVGAFILGMVLTPPDVISQTLLALPMWILFEVGVLFSKAFARRGDDAGEPADGGAPQPESPDGGGSPAPAEGPPGEVDDPDAFYAMSDEEMEAELDRIEAEEAAMEATVRKEAQAADLKASVDAKLERVVILRDNMEFEAARRLLHEVLAEGDDVQIAVARNILAQLEDDE
jgi:sec-independent protein translocase protein TatC